MTDGVIAFNINGEVIHIILLAKQYWELKSAILISTSFRKDII